MLRDSNMIAHRWFRSPRTSWRNLRLWDTFFEHWFASLAIITLKTDGRSHNLCVIKMSISKSVWFNEAGAPLYRSYTYTDLLQQCKHKMARDALGTVKYFQSKKNILPKFLRITASKPHFLAQFCKTLQLTTLWQSCRLMRLASVSRTNAIPTPVLHSQENLTSDFPFN